MTYEEAIEMMKKASTYTFAYDVDPYKWFECFELAIEAMEDKLKEEDDGK